MLTCLPGVPTLVGNVTHNATRRGQVDSDKRVIVTAPFVGICFMQVCAVRDASDHEILDVCNLENPAGTTNGWAYVIRDDEECPQRNPVQCGDDPARVHYLVAC